MTDASDDPAQTSPGNPETMEDFRAKATAFSQLTGVLGGFSMAILVLVLGLQKGNKTGHDWTVALLLLAAAAYIYASGLLANSMNVSALKIPSGRDMRSVQQSLFQIGIIVFNAGNVFLPLAIVTTIYQQSLWVSLVASIVIVLLAARVVIKNIRRFLAYSATS